MRLGSLILLGALFSALASHAHAIPLPDSCGKDEVQFKVKTQKDQSAPPAPESGKAQIVFLQQLKGAFAGAPVTRLAVDGNWVGAAKGASYFAVPVTPGVHHLCAVRQSGARMDKENAGLVTVTAELGKSYFYSFTITRESSGVVGLSNGGGTPGSPGGTNMTAKEGDTVDTIVLAALDENEASSKEKVTPMSVFTLK